MRNQIMAEISTAISENGPIILRVPSRNWGLHHYGTDETHAVVAYKVSGDDIMIRDPGWSGSPGTLDQYVQYVNDYVTNTKHQPSWALTNADGSVGGQDLSWILKTASSSTYTYVEALTPFSKQIIEGSAHSPVEVVITDPLGRKLGFDPISGIHYTDIPDSSYFRELMAATAEGDVENSTDDMPLEFTIGSYVPGDYQFEVFGTGSGPWSINFGVSDPVAGYNPTQFSFSGIATDGSYAVRDFDVRGLATSVPEASTWSLLLCGGGFFAMLGMWRRRQFLTLTSSSRHGSAYWNGVRIRGEIRCATGTG